MRARLFGLAFVVLTALVACQRTPDGTVARPTPTATPHPTAGPATPTPVPSAPIDLGRYAGKYPFDRFAGTSFLRQPAVRAAVRAAVSDGAVRRDVLDADGPRTPIAMRHGKLVAWGCESHDCGDHDWSILIAPDGSGGAVCYHDAAAMQDRSRWYRAGARPELRRGDCPSGG